MYHGSLRAVLGCAVPVTARQLSGAASTQINFQSVPVAPKASHCARLAILVPMKVSELAERTKVSAHRLRRYEAMGLIVAQRNASGYREFTDRTVREVIFISMSRELGFSLKYLSEYVPLYRAGTLTFDQMVDNMRHRIAEVDVQIAAHQALRKKLVSHIAWLKKRKREFAKRALDKSSSPWSRNRESKS